jgi:hypothetical protein
MGGSGGTGHPAVSLGLADRREAEHPRAPALGRAGTLRRFDADDADITAQFLNRDDPTYQDDAVEIFINPNPKQETVYYGFEMNARGVSTTTQLQQPDVLQALGCDRHEDCDVDPRDDERSHGHGQRLESRGLHPLGELRGTVAASRRRRCLEGELQPMGWSPAQPPYEHLVRSQNTTSWPHVPSRFGEIVFVD